MESHIQSNSNDAVELDEVTEDLHKQQTSQQLTQDHSQTNDY